MKLFSIWQMMSLLQDDRKMYNAQASYYLNTVIADKLSKKFSISFEQARYLDREALAALRSDRQVFETIMKERMQFYIVDQRNGDYLSYAGLSAQKYLKSLGIKIKDTLTDVKEIKGQSAYGGVAIGNVRVLKSSQVNDFIEGDIIVTGMTTPDFAPLMKKAGAIITNEGGVTCHAAIVSRELKKPCIIGTKIATQVLKDGDLVEVDADNGVVRML
jgi:phosphoenolpyruvate synthase/pyruvate phosphate dikinase